MRDRQRRSEVLGRQYLRATRQRNLDDEHCPRASDWSHHRRDGHRNRAPARVCDRLRPDEVLGYNSSGQLGNGNTTDSTTPVTVTTPSVPFNQFIPTVAVTGATAIGAGDFATCAIIAGGAKCWGANLGNGTNGSTGIPSQVTGLTSGVTVITPGSVTCAVVNGAAKCWGSNSGGTLGNGTTTATNVPTQSDRPHERRHRDRRQ